MYPTRGTRHVQVPDFPLPKSRPFLFADTSSRGPQVISEAKKSGMEISYFFTNFTTLPTHQLIYRPLPKPKVTQASKNFSLFTTFTNLPTTHQPIYRLF